MYPVLRTTTVLEVSNRLILDRDRAFRLSTTDNVMAFYKTCREDRGIILTPSSPFLQYSVGAPETPNPQPSAPHAHKDH